MSWVMDVDSFNAGLSFSAAAASVVMALGVALLHRSGERDGRAFVGLCAANAAMAVGDCLSWALPLPLSERARTMILVGNFVFNAAVAVLFACFTSYLHGVLDRKAAEQGRRARYPFEVAARAVMAIDVVGCIISLFNGAFFTGGGDTRYYRGEYFWLMQTLVNVLYVQALVVIVSNRGLLERRELLALLSYIMLPAVVNTVQSLFFGAALINVAIAVSLALIFMGVQQARELSAARREREMAEEHLRIIEARIDPEDLYARLDEATEALDNDPRRAAKLIGDTSRWLRERMSALR